MRAKLSDMQSFARQVDNCERKKTYKTQGSALKVAAAANNRDKKHTLNVYLCPICNQWHLTRKEQ